MIRILLDQVLYALGLDILFGIFAKIEGDAKQVRQRVRMGHPGVPVHVQVSLIGIGECRFSGWIFLSLV